MVYVQRVKTMANRLYDVWHQSTTNTHNSGNQLTPVTTLFRNGNDAEPFNLHMCTHARIGTYLRCYPSKWPLMIMMKKQWIANE